MHDLKFYSEYFFRAHPEIKNQNELKASSTKDKQQLLNESASAANGLVPRNEARSEQRPKSIA